MNNNKCIVFTGGGTAGHVFPALSVVQKLVKHWKGRVIWIGSRSGMEKRLLRGFDLTYYGIPSGKWRRYLSFQNFLDVFKVLSGIFYALVLLKREKPAMLFSKGGYVSVPPVIAAWLLRIPVFTHESDYNPGLANRINALFAEKILISFRATRVYFSSRGRASAGGSRRVVLTGNPVREMILSGDAARGRRILGCPKGLPVILVLGGSLGSSSINRVISELIDELTEKYFVAHQMGIESYVPSNRANYRTAPFWREEFPDILASADLVISRAGANTLSELAATAKPAVLVPLPLSGSRGDQIHNATFFAERGAALVFNEETDSPYHLLRAISELLSAPHRLRAMGERMRALGYPWAAETIAKLILERVE
jgi:UDP-N-acetylglucosamine--N-acetylmuramyl-(pentapeptide) pyrophosphoryl-undecaprenol N-acetylglucosamine transferase